MQINSICNVVNDSLKTESKVKSGGMGTINFFDKDKADEIAAMGFKYVVHKINANQVVYSFVDTPKLREKLANNYAKTEYYSSKYLCL